MKKSVKPDLLPLGVLLLAVLGGLLRYRLYQVGVDEKNLLVEGHPLELGIWLCTAAAFASVGFGLLRQKKSVSPAPVVSALGHVLGAFGILLTVLFSGNHVPQPFAAMWKFAGILALAGMLYAAVAMALGKRPFFGVYAVLCLFFALHLVGHYKSWCSDPQLQNYVFSFLGALALMGFSYHCAAALLNRRSDRAMRGWGLLAAYCSLVALSATEYPFLYLGCALWALLCLYSPEKEASADAAT